MGTKCAPSYANIFMGWFEEKFIFPLLTNLSDFYLRFIDDIFLVWNGTKAEFDGFLKKMNVILNMKCLKQKSISSTPQCLKQITNCELKCMSNQPTGKVINTANQKIQFR